MIKEKFKKNLVCGVIVLIVTLTAATILQHKVIKSIREQYSIALTNTKSLLNDKNEEIIELKLSLDMLQHTSDSTIQALLEQKEKLEIKDKELVYMMALLSQSKVKDTIRVTTHDTIFVEPDFKFDTCISDEWRTTCVGLKYPNEVSVDATVRSRKGVFVTAKRETVEPPAKCFFIRWFQRKHTVTKVVIDEENPYIESEDNVFIRVVE